MEPETPQESTQFPPMPLDVFAPQEGEKVRRMGPLPRVNLQTIKEAIRYRKGKIYMIAWDLGISSVTLNEYIKKHDLYEELREARGRLYDIAEYKLFEKIDQGDVKAICCPRGTPIALSYMESSPIEEIDVGDRVLSHNGYKRKVLGVHKRDYRGSLYSVYTEYLVRPLRLTPEHPVYVKAKNDKEFYFVSVDKIQVGSLLHRPIVGFVYGKVSRIEIEEYEGVVYNLEVEEDYTYVAEGVSVHNCFFLQTAVKHRGYTFRQDLRIGGDPNSPPVGSVNMSMIDIDTLPLHLKTQLLEHHEKIQRDKTMMEGTIDNTGQVKIKYEPSELDEDRNIPMPSDGLDGNILGIRSSDIMKNDEEE